MFLDQPIIKCIGCPEAKIDMNGHKYTPKSKLPENLFENAPVMVRTHHYEGIQWRLRYYASDRKCYDYGKTGYTNKYTDHMPNSTSTWKYIRLPTIDEAPRGTWLAAPKDGKCPKGAENLMVMGWNAKHKIPYPEILKGRQWCWPILSRFMIFDDEQQDIKCTS
jgi:hypothetical protein